MMGDVDTIFPNIVAYKNVTRVISVLVYCGRRSDRVVDSAEGGRAVYIKNGKRYAIIECLNDGSIQIGVSDREGFTDGWLADVATLESAIARALAFIDAGEGAS